MTEWNAADYHRHSTLQEAMAAEQLARLTLRGDERVLDVGCGDGKVTASIAARLPRGSVLGVDPSRNMIAFAAERYMPASHPNLQFAVADVRSLPYQGEFDLVVSFNALHWVHEAETALRCVREALKANGRAHLRFVGRAVRRSLEDVIDEVRRAPRWAGYFQDFTTPHAQFTPEEYRAAAERAGLHGVRIVLHDLAWDFGTRAAFAGFAGATFVAWMRMIPENERTLFLDEALDAYRCVAVDRPGEENTFKFYQMEVTLSAS